VAKDMHYRDLDDAALVQELARGAMERAIQKLPIKARFVTRASMEEV